MNFYKSNQTHFVWSFLKEKLKNKSSSSDDFKYSDF